MSCDECYYTAHPGSDKSEDDEDDEDDDDDEDV